MSKIPISTRLDHANLLQAVADYQLVVSFGALSQLHAELSVVYREHEQLRLRRPIGADFYATTVARELAVLLDCDSAELLSAVRLYLNGDDRPAVALKVLHDLAERLRRERKGVA